MHDSLDRTWAAVGRELGGLSRAASLLQSQLSPGCVAGDIREAMQSLDLITQTLACLARFVTQMSAAGEGAPALTDALSEIGLAALAARLGGGPSGETVAEPVRYELF